MLEHIYILIFKLLAHKYRLWHTLIECSHGLAKIKHFNHLTIAQCRFLRKFDIINFCGLALVERQFNPCKIISNYVWFHCLQKHFSRSIHGVDKWNPKWIYFLKCLYFQRRSHWTCKMFFTKNTRKLSRWLSLQIFKLGYFLTRCSYYRVDLWTIMSKKVPL